MDTELTHQDVHLFAKGASLSIIGKLLGRTINFILDVILARGLGASAFGLFSIGWTIFRILQMVIPLGLPQGVIKYIPEYRRKNESKNIASLILGGIGLTILTGLLVGIIFYLLSPFISDKVFQKAELRSILQLFSVIFPFCSLLTITSAISRTSSNMKYTILMEDIGQPIIALLLIITSILIFHLTIEIAILADTFSFLITGLGGLIIVRKLFHSDFITIKKVDYSILKSVLAFSIPTSIAGVFSVFVFWVDRLIIGVYLPSTDNGIYQAISQISMVFVILYAAFNAILGPIFSNLYAENKTQRLEAIYKVGTKWNFYLGVIPFLIILMQSSNLISFIFGKEYILGWRTLIILSFGQLINCGTGSIGMLLVMAGKQNYWFWLTTMALFANAVLCIILVPVMGISGAAIGTTLAVGGMNICATFVGKTQLGLWPYDRRFLKGIFAGLFAGISGFCIPFLNLPDFVALITTCIVVVLIFIFLLVLFKLDTEDRLLLQLVSMPAKKK